MRLSTSLPDDLPWHAQHAFLLLDGATVSDLPKRMKNLNPDAGLFALYDRPPFASLRDISPLLVEVQQPEEPIFQYFLEQAQNESGWLFFSPAPAYSVARHLRKLLTVELPQGQTVLLRLADAAVMQALFSHGNQSLFGPLCDVIIADSIGGDWHRHQPRLPECPELPMPYRLTPQQNAALDQVDRRRALLDLDSHLRRYFPEQHAGQTLALRWPALEQRLEEAQALGLSGPSELFYYANLTAWLAGATTEQRAQIDRLLQTPSLQPPGERIALAADLAQRWAIERGPA